MDPTIPLTQYITRRTYKGTSENVSRLFSGKGVQGIWDNYSYEIRRGHGGHAGPGPSPPGPTPQVPPSTKNCNCTKEGVRDCWNRIGKTNNKYFKLQTVAECSVGGKCECSYIALTLKDTTSGPSKIILHPQIPLYWAGVLQDDSVEFMSEIDPCGKGTNPSTGGGNVNFFLAKTAGPDNMKYTILIQEDHQKKEQQQHILLLIQYHKQYYEFKHYVLNIYAILYIYILCVLPQLISLIYNFLKNMPDIYHH